MEREFLKWTSTCCIFLILFSQCQSEVLLGKGKQAEISIMARVTNMGSFATCCCQTEQRGHEEHPTHNQIYRSLRAQKNNAPWKEKAYHKTNSSFSFNQQMKVGSSVGTVYKRRQNRIWCSWGWTKTLKYSSKIKSPRIGWFKDRKILISKHLWLRSAFRQLLIQVFIHSTDPERGKHHLQILSMSFK